MSQDPEPNNLWECYVPRKRRTKLEIIKDLEEKFLDLNYKIYSKRGGQNKRIIQKQLNRIEKFEKNHLSKLEHMNFFDNIYENPLALKYKIKFNVMKLKYERLKLLNDKSS